MDFYLALELIDVVGTFSVIPRTSLPPVMAFISYAYYQGTRMNRHKNLADKAWETFQHILQSHLSAHGVAALLDVLSREEPQWSRASFATVSGALRLLHEKIPFGDSSAGLLPAAPISDLLGSLQRVVTEGDEILKEQVIAILNRIMADDAAVLELDSVACWDNLVLLLQQCDVAPDNADGAALLDRVAAHFNALDSDLLERLATVFIKADKELPKATLDHILAPFNAPRRLAGADELTHDRLLETLYTGKQLRTELRALIVRDLEFLASTGERRDWIQLVQKYLAATLSEETFIEAAMSCATMLCALLHSTLASSESDSQVWKVFQAFHAVSKVAVSAPRPEARLCAFRTLSRLRATITGHVYLTEDEAADDTVATLAAGTAPGQVLASTLPKKLWLDEVLVLVDENEMHRDRRCASFVLTALPDQLSNLSLFADQAEYIQAIYDIAIEKLAVANSTTAASYVRVLTALVSYCEAFSPAEQRHIVDLFIRTAGSSDTVSKDCIHALTICCHEMADAIARELDNLIQKMAQMITQKHLAIHVLEFLTGLSRLPFLFRNFRPEDYRKVFGVCISYLQSLRDNQLARQSATSDNSSSSHQGAHEIMPQYVCALAHHVIVFWYLILRPDDRQVIKKYITQSLSYLEYDNQKLPDDQGLVVLDFMDRVDREVGESFASNFVPDGHLDDLFDEVDGRILEQNRIYGLVLVSTQTSLRTAKTLVTTRRPSGTAKYLVFGRTTLQRGSWASDRSITATPSSLSGYLSEDERLAVYSDDVDGLSYGSISVPSPSSSLGSSDIIVLPEDLSLVRAIQTFDRTPGIDSHKAGVLYIGEGQTTEAEILSNSSGSPDYRDIVQKLGTLQKLKGARFNPQGLDTHDNADGEHTIVWNNEITELVFHVTTMMPTDLDEPQMSAMSKKRHVGNDFVNIVFNNSGIPFRFDTIPSAFNYVYIVITPSVRTTFLQTRTHTMNTSETHRFYRVEVVTRDDFPAISSAAEPKMISGASLPGYIRNLALNACVFSEVWVNRDEEYRSSWRTRLDQIRRLRERYTAQWAEPRAVSKGKGKRA